MYLKKLVITSFGKLQNYTIDFAENESCLYIWPNESGKSTVLACIKALFYGLGARGKKFNLYKKYTNFDGTLPQAALTFVHENMTFELIRSFKATNSKDLVTLTNLDLGEKINLQGQEPGEFLFALSAENFQSYVLIEQMRLTELSADSQEVVEALSRLSISGQTEVNIAAALADLENESRKLEKKTGHGGLIPETEEKIEILQKAEATFKQTKAAAEAAQLQADEELRQINIRRREQNEALQLMAKFREMQAEQQSCVQKKAELEAELHLLSRNIWEETDKLQQQLQQAEKDLTAAQVLVKLGEKDITSRLEQITLLQEELKRLQTKKEEKLQQLQLCRDRQLQLEAQKEDLRRQQTALTTQLSENQAEKEKLQSEKRQLQARKVLAQRLKISAAATLIAAVSSVAAAICLPPNLFSLAAIGAALTLLLLIADGYYFVQLKRMPDVNLTATEINLRAENLAKDEITLLIKKSTLENRNDTPIPTEDAAALQSAYTEISTKIDALQQQIQTLQTQNEQKKAETATLRGEKIPQIEALCAKLRTQMAKVKADGAAKAAEQQKRISARTETAEATKARIASGEKYFTACHNLLLSAGLNPPPEAELAAASYVDQLNICQKYLQNYLQATGDKLLELNNNYQLSSRRITELQQQIKADCEKKAQLEEYRRKLCKYRQRQQELTQARELLEELQSDLQKNFSPKLCQAAGKYLACMSNQRYQEITVDKSLKIQVLYDNITRETAEYLSGGAYDQIYLALRLALAEMLLDKFSMPLLLDDTLVQMDAAHQCAALQALQEFAAANRVQIIFFTCHDYMKDSVKKAQLTWRVISSAAEK